MVGVIFFGTESKTALLFTTVSRYFHRAQPAAPRAQFSLKLAWIEEARLLFLELSRRQSDRPGA